MSDKKVIDIDDNTQQTLEFDRVKRLVAEHALTAQAKERAIATLPYADPADVESVFALLAELIALDEHGETVPIGGLRDIRDYLALVQPADSYLEPSQYWVISEFCEIAGECKQFFHRHRDAVPNCFIKFNALSTMKDLIWVIRQKINSRGELMDSATPRLRELRRQIGGIQEHIHRRLEQFLQSFRDSGILQDDFFSIRNDRFVLPIRSGSKKQMPGIIHGASNTGETLFIEPFEIVEESNDLADLRIQESNEIRRILIAIGEAVRHNSNALLSNVDLMADLDYLHARLVFAVKNRFSIPEFGKGYPERTKSLVLYNAHHPLLFAKEPDKSIPIDLWLRPEDRVLVITGPNAGGKTTTLKTIGLIALLFQSGIPVPCSPNSTIEFYNGIYADIGDEQDVERGLSTFTAHVRNMTHILETGTPDSLVLLDEVGTATDPNEGAALAVAILEELSRIASLTIVTSHLSGLKEWAHIFPEARNAAVKLDETTRFPTYKIYMDVPGTSEALIIARQEGMPDSIISRARDILQHDELNLSDLILSLQKKEQEIDEKSQQVNRDMIQAREQQTRYEGLVNEMERHRKQFKREMLEEKERLISETKNRIEHMIAELPTREALSEARKEIIEEKKHVEEEIKHIEDEIKPVDEILKEIQEKEVVFLPAFNQYGIISKISERDGVAEVKIRDIKARVPLHELEPVPQERKQKVLRDLLARQTGIKINISNTAHYEIDLHGYILEDAVPIVDKFLDDAVVHNLPFVKIIHGHGSGRLMKGLHDYFKSHPHVESYRFALPSEGGSAATIVHLK